MGRFEAEVLAATGNLIKVNRAAADLFAAMHQFGERFDELRAHYGTRLRETAGRSFWASEMERHPDPVVLTTTQARGRTA